MEDITGSKGYEEHNDKSDYEEHNVMPGYEEHNVMSSYEEHNIMPGYEEHNVQPDYEVHNVQLGDQEQILDQTAPHNDTVFTNQTDHTLTKRMTKNSANKPNLFHQDVTLSTVNKTSEDHGNVVKEKKPNNPNTHNTFHFPPQEKLNSKELTIPSCNSQSLSTIGDAISTKSHNYNSEILDGTKPKRLSKKHTTKAKLKQSPNSNANENDISQLHTNIRQAKTQPKEKCKDETKASHVFRFKTKSKLATESKAVSERTEHAKLETSTKSKFSSNPILEKTPKSKQKYNKPPEIEVYNKATKMHKSTSKQKIPDRKEIPFQNLKQPNKNVHVHPSTENDPTFLLVHWVGLKRAKYILCQRIRTISKMLCLSLDEADICWSETNEKDLSGTAIITIRKQEAVATIVERINQDRKNKFKASVASMKKAAIILQVNIELEDIQHKANSPLRCHQEKILQIQSVIDHLKRSRKGKRLDMAAAGHTMGEIAAREKEIKLLKKQEHNFIEVKTSVEMELNQLKFQFQAGDKSFVNLTSYFDRELSRFKACLPIYAFKLDVISCLKEHNVCVVLGETGSGKSTQLAQYLYEEDVSQGKIIACTQPRKVACTTLAKRVAQEMRKPLGNIVGYNVGIDRKMTNASKIAYFTDHMLLRECLNDPTFSKYGCIIIDEAHERSVYTDLLIAMIKKAMDQRPDLKVLITSATIDPEIFVKYFGECNVISVSGKTYPVDVEYTNYSSIETYFDVAVSIAEEVFHKYTTGDILVFLTTPLETEKACEKLMAQIKSQTVVILPLHGQLQYADQVKVFEGAGSGKRKIIFATNCAETSVTLPNIKYVIDTGMAKEKLYDTRRSVSTLQQTRITKSSAKQRRGRAGRTQSGTCFRLYTEEEFDNLTPNAIPEIMRMHLGQALLLLLNLEIKDPLSFEFIEAPPRESLVNAIATLEMLGAVFNGGITDLGRRLCRLSLEPKLGKLLLDGIDRGIGLDAIVISAIYSTGANLFFRFGTEEDKDKADRFKTLFCREEGDVYTLLNVYKTWNSVNDSDKTKWCLTNSINAKSAKIIHNAVKELKYVTKTVMGIPVPSRFAAEDVLRATIPTLLLSTFSSNIGMYLGFQRAGYVLPFDEMQIAYIHPSSSFRYLDEKPKWVLFETVLTTTRNYMINVISIEEQDVINSVEDGVLDLDLDALNEKIIYPCQLDTYFGKQLMSRLTGPKYVTLKEMEEELSALIKTTVFMQRADNHIDMHVPKQYQTQAMNLFQEKVDILRKTFKEETLEIGIRNTGETRISLQQGGEISSILLTNEFVSLQVDTAPHPWSKEEATDFFETYGEVLTCTPFGGRRRNPSHPWGVVTFITKDHAQSALDCNLNIKETGISVRPICQGFSPDASLQMPFSFMVKWCRRPLRGFAVIKFRPPELWQYCLDNIDDIQIGVSRTGVSKCPYEGMDLFALDVEQGITASDIIQSINSSLNITTDITETDVHFPREKPYESMGEVEHFATHLKRICSEIDMRSDSFTISVNAPRPKDFDMVAYVNLCDLSNVWRLQDTIRNRYRHFKYRPLIVDVSLRSSCTFRQQVHRVVRDGLETAQEKFTDVHFQLRAIGYNMLKLTMSTEHCESLEEAQFVISKIVQGEEVPVNRNLLMYFTTEKGSSILKEIEASCGVYIYSNFRDSRFHFYGHVQSKQNAMIETNARIAEIQNLRHEEVSLSSSPGLIKSLYKKFGLKLQRFIHLIDATVLQLMPTRRTLYFQGTDEAYRKLLEELENMKTKHCGQPMNDNPSLLCPVCFSEPDLGERYILESCGHVYCSECIHALLLNAVTERHFPITCATENCAVPISIADIKSLSSPAHLTNLTVAATENMVTKSGGQYKYCITPDCDAIYRTIKLSDRSSALKGIPCYKCQVNVCTTCHVEYHTGVSCYLYRGRQKDKDFDLTVYRQRNKVIECKRCTRLIQKIYGCNHITCPCGAHLCWICQSLFDTDVQMYFHQRHCRDGVEN